MAAAVTIADCRYILSDLEPRKGYEVRVSFPGTVCPCLGTCPGTTLEVSPSLLMFALRCLLEVPSCASLLHLRPECGLPCISTPAVEETGEAAVGSSAGAGAGVAAPAARFLMQRK